jgi:GLPGLI family protein
MLNYIIILILLFTSSLTFSQKNEKATVYKYTFFCRENTSEEYEKTSMSLITNGQTKYYLPTDYASKVSNVEEKKFYEIITDPSGNLEIKSFGEVPYSQQFLIKDIQSNEIFEILDIKMEDAEDKFYTISKEKLKWEIVDSIIQSKTYGIPVQKAYTSYKGRKYQAFFAPSIPFNLGPFKFDGLPGLVVILFDLESNFVYNIESITEEIFDHSLYDVKQVLEKFSLLSKKDFNIKRKEIIRKLFARENKIAINAGPSSLDGGLTWTPFKYIVRKQSDLLIEIED